MTSFDIKKRNPEERNITSIIEQRETIKIFYFQEIVEILICFKKKIFLQKDKYSSRVF